MVGIVAALRPEKNHERFIGCAAEILRKRSDSHFVIAGSGPEEEHIRVMANRLGVQDAVHLIGSTDEIPAVLSMIDLFVLTSHNEANPVSILEAMSVQRPVVAPDVGSIRESVVDGVTGYVIAKNDLAQMTDRWLAILNNPSRAWEMGAAARRHVQKVGSLDSMTEGYSRLIEDLYRRQTDRKFQENMLNNPGGSPEPVIFA